jgi:vacuolar-type H+-ATPase subunit I/STV1
MEFERYYLDLFEMLNAACKRIASGKYEKSDSEKLFEFAKKGRYPGLLAELAESFGMMLVKVEAREFERVQIIEELEAAKAKLEEYSEKLEKELEECCPEEFNSNK